MELANFIATDTRRDCAFLEAQRPRVDGSPEDMPVPEALTSAVPGRVRSRSRVPLVIVASIGLFLGLASIGVMASLCAVVIAVGEIVIWLPRERIWKRSVERRRDVAAYLKAVLRRLDDGWDSVDACRAAVKDLPCGEVRGILEEIQVTPRNNTDGRIPFCEALATLREQEARLGAAALALANRYGVDEACSFLGGVSHVMDARVCMRDRLARTCRSIRQVCMASGCCYLAILWVVTVMGHASGANGNSGSFLPSATNEVGCIVAMLAWGILLRLSSPLTWGAHE